MFLFPAKHKHLRGNFWNWERIASIHSVSKLEESVAVFLGCWLWFFSRHLRLFPCICETPVTTRPITLWLFLRRLVFFFFFPVIVAKLVAFTISQASFTIYPRLFVWLQLYSCTKLCPNLMSVFETRLIDAKDLKRVLYAGKCAIEKKSWWKDDDVCQLRLPFALYTRGSARTENELCKPTAERENESLREWEKEFITVNANEMFPAYNSLSLSVLIKEEA